MSSADGSAAYIENLRTLYLYEEAASEKKGIYPGNQAGDADMFDWNKDTIAWTPSSYWIWNLRAEISANMSSGNYQLNVPIFDMYINDLSNIETWTKANMGGLPGACVPETMRFNGNGGDPGSGSCTEAASPLWNAEDITSGPEMSPVHVGAVRGHRQPRVPEAGVPVHGGDRPVPARLPAGRLGRAAARGRQRARDPVGGAGPDDRHRRRPGDLPDHRRRRAAGGRQARQGPAAHPVREGADARSPRTRGPTTRPAPSCSTPTTPRRRPRPPTRPAPT